MTPAPTHRRRVVVVGAGPAGAALALLLARAGLPVTLVEASTSLTRQFRGEALLPSGLEVLAAMGLLEQLSGLPQRTLAGWRFLLDGRELFTAVEPLGEPPERPCTLVSQAALLNALLQQAGTCASFSLEQGQPVVELLWQGERVAGVRLRDGRQLPADLVLACDGRASLLRQQAGLTLQSESSPIDLLWFELAHPSPPPLAGCFTTLVGRQGLLSAFESASGNVQLGWVLEQGARPPNLTADGWIARMAALCPPELAAWLRASASGLSSPTRLAIQVGLAERWWRPGLLLLGDAAHPMSPVRAQGINMALRDAWVAFVRLRPLLAGATTPTATPAQIDAALAAIEAERRPEIAGLQALQAAEAARGELLRRQPWLRRGLGLAAPLLGPAIATHWREQQQPLRRGLAVLPPPP